MRHNIIKIFISSTFREMIKERDDIRQIAFSKLRFWGKQMGVMIVAVDLRWGITEADIAEGKLADLCADAIDVCAPYFVAILGNSYGTDDPKVLGGVDKKYRGKSVTDFEITKGVLECGNNNALIYNITYSSFKESFLKKRKLSRLKKEIHACRQMIDINRADRLISTMVNDIQELVRQEISSDYSLTTVEKSDYSVKSSYFSQYYNAYYSKEYIDRFRCEFAGQHCVVIRNDESDLVSMFMYNLAFGPEGLKVIYHDFKMPEYSKDKAGLIRHIVEHVSVGKESYLGLSNPDEEDLCAAIACGGPVDVFIDSMDVLDSAVADSVMNMIRALGHIDNVHFVISDYGNSGFFADSVEFFDIPEFSRDEAEKFVRSYLDEYKKNNNEELTSNIVRHILDINYSNPIFLQLIMNEILMRGCPSEMILSEIDSFAGCRDIGGLSEVIIGRMQTVFGGGKGYGDLIKHICLATCLSEDFLPDVELHAIIDIAEGNCAYVDEALQYVGEYLIICDRAYKFRHKGMTGIVKSIFADEIEEFDRNVYFAYYSQLPCNAHVALEICMYYMRHDDVEGLMDYIMSPTHFCYLYYDRSRELMQILSRSKAEFIAGIKKLSSDRTWYDIFFGDDRFYLGVIGVIEYLGEYDYAIELINRRSAGGNCTPELTYRLAQIYRDKADYHKALEILEKIEVDDFENTELSIKISDCRSYCLGKIGQYNESKKHAVKAINLRKLNPEKFEYDLPVSYNSKAYSCFAAGDYTRAIELYEDSKNIRVKHLGVNHPRVANNMNNIAKCYIRMGQMDKAGELLDKALGILRNTVGEEHVYYMIAKTNQLKCMIAECDEDTRFRKIIKELAAIKTIFLEKMGVSDYTYSVDVLTAECFNHIGMEQEAERLFSNAYDYFAIALGSDSYECREIDALRG